MYRLMRIGALACAAWISLEVMGAGIGAFRRALNDAIPLDRATRGIYRALSDIAEPASVEFPLNETTDFVKASLRQGVEAVATRASATARSASRTTSFSVKPNVEEAQIRLMNISPEYENGMQLSPQKYDVEVSKEGYRTTRFWATVPPETAGNSFELSVELDRLGVPNCEQNVALSNYGGAFSTGGQVLQSQIIFRKADIDDLYLSFSDNMEHANFIYVVESVANEGYVELRFLQPTNLSEKEINNNALVEIDPDRFVFNKMIFEVQGADVLATHQAFMPQGVVVNRFDERLVCENVFKF